VAAHGNGHSRQLAAYVVAAGSPHAEVASLRAFLRERLADHLVPVYYVLLDSLPLTPSGKINRRALPLPAGLLEGSVSSPFVAPANPLEELIAGIWREVLGQSRVGTRDHFLELGGTSFLVARIQHALESKLGRPVPITDLLQFPTVGQLADHLAQKEGGLPSLQRDAIAERAGRQRAAMAKRRPARPPTED
jgi:acyl carrier protein